jgi:molybdenum cofactor cytidylyltransferase
MICAIALAAGRSRRMGRQKLLLPFAGSTVIGHIVDQIAASVVDEVCLVVGPDSAAIRKAFANRPVRIAVNPEPESEMLDSVRCGLRALSAECQAVVVVLGDQPGVTAEMVNTLVAAFDGSGKGIAVPVHDGSRGHPLVFSTRYSERVLTEYDEVGLRGLLRDYPEDVLEVPVPWPAALSDMDLPEDYRRELARLQRKYGE